MKIRRTLAPAAAPLGFRDILHGAAGLVLGGRYLKRLERELKAYFGVRYVFPVSSGKAALTLILQALKSLAPDRHEVLIPAYTCFSVPSAIVKAGLTVALCDINPRTFDFDYNLLEKSVTKNTLCVVPSHLFGIPSDVGRIVRLGSAQSAFVVEDGAQAMGGTIAGKKIGALGDVAFFSFGRGKNVTCGSGGVIVTNIDRIANEIRKIYASLPGPAGLENLMDLAQAVLLAFFIRPRLFWFPSGLKFLKLGETFFDKEFPLARLSGMKAGLLRRWRKRLEEANRVREKNAAYLSRQIGIEIFRESAPSLLRLPLLAADRETRDRICFLSLQKGMGISRMYPTAVNRIEEIKKLFSGKTFPSADRVAETIFTLPVHQYLSTKDKEETADFVKGLMPEEQKTSDAAAVPIIRPLKTDTGTKADLTGRRG